MTTDSTEPEVRQSPVRRKLPDERSSITHKFNIGGHEGYITAGLHEDGTLGEVFLADIGKQGSTMRGVMDGFATMLSMSLQYGVPLDKLALKFTNMKFDPAGDTDNPEIPHADSMLDYIFRWLALRFGDDDLRAELRLPLEGKEG